MFYEMLKQTTIIDQLGDENLSVAPIHFSMTSYGADYTVTGLVKRLANGDIFVPSFQRSFVWTKQQSSRFIESLLLGLPVPGIFLSKEYETEKYLIIDGQQRLKTLQFFYEGIFQQPGKEDEIFDLVGVQKEYAGKIFKTLSEKMRRRLDNSLIHATIVKQDKPPEDDSSIYYLFERLNTGETNLDPQEIRSCIYRGEFNQLIKQLNNNDNWRELFGPIHNRMRDQELILRFFALYYDIALYSEPMKGFLNKFMAKNKDLTIRNADVLKNLFDNAVKFILNNLGCDAFKPKGAFNAAVFDSIMIGVGKRLEQGPITDSTTFVKLYNSLLKNDTYNNSISSTTGSYEKVSNRIKLATRFFDDAE